MRFQMISFALGAMKFYPASLRFLGENKAKYPGAFNMQEPSGSVELNQGSLIQYYFPLEQ